MDQALKARLVGAAILVAAAVIIIPELLSGRKTAVTAPTPAPNSSATRTYTIELGAPSTPAGSTAAETTPEARLPAPDTIAKASEPVAETPSDRSPPRSLPVTSDMAPASSNPAEAKAAAVRKPPADQVATAPAVASTADPPQGVETTAAPRPAGGKWSVQVGAFGAQASARKLAGDLAAAGFDAFVSPTSKGGNTLHRVRVGAGSSRSSADALVVRLKARGLPATVVAND